MNVVCIGPLAPHSRVVADSCRTRHLCALCVSPFPNIRSALDSHASSLVLDPPSLSFLPSFGDMTARMPPSSSGPPLISSPLFPVRSLVQGAHHGCVYFHCMNRLCIPSPSHPLLVCCAPPPFASIKIPMVLALLLRPILLAFKVEL